MGAEIPRWIHGKSLLSLMQGKTDAHKDAVFCQGGVEADATQRAHKPERPSVKQKVLLDFPEAMVRAKMIRTERFKYIYRLAGDCELYDLQEDPNELHNLAGEASHANIAAGLKDRLLRFMLETETNLPEIETLYA